MQADELFDSLRGRLWQIAEAKKLLQDTVEVTGRPLTTEEAIGSPVRQDFPLVKGKEKLMQAVFRGAKGQAFTDMPGDFQGSLQDIITKELSTHFDKAVFVATMNAVLAYLGQIQATVHCKDEEPEDCACQLVGMIKEEYCSPRIALVGFQPAMLQQLAQHFAVRVLDLDQDRIGTQQFGVMVEDGDSAMQEVLAWSELIVATGSTVANGSIVNFLEQGRPVVFFGTTVAGAAQLMGWKRFCPCASV